MSLMLPTVLHSHPGDCGADALFRMLADDPRAQAGRSRPGTARPLGVPGRLADQPGAV